LCYNGNLCTKEQLEVFSLEFPQVNALMLGRGFVGDPGMLSSTPVEKLQKFHDDLLESYTVAFGGSRNAMFRLKENWRYLLCLFENSEKLGKQLRKATDIAQYKQITYQIFTTLPKRQKLLPDW
jgi:tRNA-dihydrouridine synthase